MASADATLQQWAASVLHGLHIPQTPGGVRALVGWAKLEGGHFNNDARYNPLNTTLNLPGSGDTGSQGNISVYKDWHQGVEATVKTLKNGRYDGIIAALRGGNPAKVAAAVGASPWGTNAANLARVIQSVPMTEGAKPFDGSVATGAMSDRADGGAAHDAAIAALTAPKKGTPAGTELVAAPAAQKLQAVQQFGRHQIDAVGLAAAVKPTAVPTTGSLALGPSAAAAAAKDAGASSDASHPSADVIGGKGGVAKITGPNPGRIVPEVVHFMRQISAIGDGSPVVGSDGTGHSLLTVNGNVSEHSTGHASDIPAAGARLIRLGQHALIAAGMPEAQARKQTGGLYNVVRDGKRYQIIFNTHEGGDHTDHLHVGVKDL